MSTFTAETKQQVRRRSGWMCERCQRLPITQYHHRRPKGMGGALVDNSLANCAGLCTPCHGWVHSHPAEAYAQGWLIRRSDPRTPAEIQIGEPE